MKSEDGGKKNHDKPNHPEHPKHPEKPERPEHPERPDIDRPRRYGRAFYNV
ncbi:hypothetical protein KJ039_05700 [bacterium]|nr:hypothetical protein [bacterium]